MELNFHIKIEVKKINWIRIQVIGMGIRGKIVVKQGAELGLGNRRSK